MKVGERYYMETGFFEDEGQRKFNCRGDWGPEFEDYLWAVLAVL